MRLLYNINNVHWVNPTSDNIGAYIVGTTTLLSDGVLTHTFTGKRGFITPLVLTLGETSCFTYSHSWDNALSYSTGTIPASPSPSCMIEVDQNNV